MKWELVSHSASSISCTTPFYSAFFYVLPSPWAPLLLFASCYLILLLLAQFVSTHLALHHQETVELTTNSSSHPNFSLKRVLFFEGLVGSLHSPTWPNTCPEVVYLLCPLQGLKSDQKHMLTQTPNSNTIVAGVRICLLRSNKFNYFWQKPFHLWNGNNHGLFFLIKQKFKLIWMSSGVPVPLDLRNILYEAIMCDEESLSLVKKIIAFKPTVFVSVYYSWNCCEK